MEALEKELGLLIDKLNDANDFRRTLDNINSIYPFSKYEYIISSLLSKNILSFDEFPTIKTIIMKNLKYMKVR